MTELRKLRVFLCHASQDKPIVRELYQRLLGEEWIDPWLDEEKLLPGQYWAEKIEDAVESSDAVIVFLSKDSVTKEGVVQKEIKRAIDKAEEKLEDSIFIIPLRLEDCLVPKRLKNYQYQDYFDNIDPAYKRLCISLEKRAESLGIEVEKIKYYVSLQIEENAKLEREKKIRREAEERIRREEEYLIRQKAEEKARKALEIELQKEINLIISLEKEELKKKRIEEKIRLEVEEDARKEKEKQERLLNETKIRLEKEKIILLEEARSKIKLITVNDKEYLYYYRLIEIAWRIHFNDFFAIISWLIFDHILNRGIFSDYINQKLEIIIRYSWNSGPPYKNLFYKVLDKSRKNAVLERTLREDQYKKQ